MAIFNSYVSLPEGIHAMNDEIYRMGLLLDGWKCTQKSLFEMVYSNK